MTNFDYSIPPNPVITYTPVVFKVPGRQVDLQIKVSAPATGTNLPIILFSHGHGQSNFLSSLRGYGPLVDYYAAQGFIVIQPTHQDSKILGLDPTGAEGPLFWHSRATDMHFILDNLDVIGDKVPFLKGRIDKNKIAAIGHSMGGHTVGMLAGMQVTHNKTGEIINLIAPRIKAFVMFGTPGKGSDLAAFASEHYPILRNQIFDTMTMPVLVVAGDKDQHPAFSERADWRMDAYNLSPAPKSLLTIFDGGHILGGISGYDSIETNDESPERVALVQQLTTAYLRSALNSDNNSWEDAKLALQNDENVKAKIESK